LAYINRTTGFTPIIIDEAVAADFIAAREQVSRLIINLFNKNKALCES
jgi:hypothetical protein